MVESVGLVEGWGGGGVTVVIRNINLKVVDRWVAGWLTDNNATPWPILQAERLARISAELSLQDGPSVAIKKSVYIYRIIIILFIVDIKLHNDTAYHCHTRSILKAQLS